MRTRFLVVERTGFLVLDACLLRICPFLLLLPIGLRALLLLERRQLVDLIV